MKRRPAVFLCVLLLSGQSLLAQKPGQDKPRTPTPAQPPNPTQPRTPTPNRTPPQTPAPTQTQTTTGGQGQTTQETPAAPVTEIRQRPEKFRLRLMAGFGYQSFHPALLSEAGPAWQLNSFIQSADGVSQPNVLIENTGKIPAIPLRWGLDFTFKDRFSVALERFYIDQDYDHKHRAKVSFISPPNSTYQVAAFEGLRLLAWKERRNEMEFMYLHPISTRKGIKLGGFLTRQQSVESVEVSMGSLTGLRASGASGGTQSWTAGGSVSGEYRISGWLVGPAVRYQMFEWLGFTYKFSLIKRAGDFNMTGYQLLSAQNYDLLGQPSGAVSPYLLVPVHGGYFRDNGTRHWLEAVARVYCRYSIHLGFIKEDYTRTYDSYAGITLSQTRNFNPKTSGLGVGEMSQGFKSSRTEIYLKFGVHFYY